MNPSKLAVGVRFGFITSLIYILISLGLYVTGLANPNSTGINMVINLIIIGLGLYLAFSNYKAANEGYISMSEIMVIMVWLSLVIGLFMGLFSWIYMQYIDPSMMTKVMEMQRIELEKRDMPEKDIEKVLEMAGSMFKPYIIIPMQMFFSLIMGLLLSLVLSLAVKKDRPIF